MIANLNDRWLCKGQFKCLNVCNIKKRGGCDETTDSDDRGADRPWCLRPAEYLLQARCQRYGAAPSNHSLRGRGTGKGAGIVPDQANTPALYSPLERLQQRRPVPHYSRLLRAGYVLHGRSQRQFAPKGRNPMYGQPGLRACVDPCLPRICGAIGTPAGHDHPAPVERQIMCYPKFRRQFSNRYLGLAIHLDFIIYMRNAGAGFG
jgi:hypothetical protein